MYTINIEHILLLTHAICPNIYTAVNTKLNALLDNTFSPIVLPAMYTSEYTDSEDGIQNEIINNPLDTKDLHHKMPSWTVKKLHAFA